MTNEDVTAGVGRFGLCAGCSYFPEHLKAARCIPGDICVRAHSGRQIDRFFRTTPSEAQHYLNDLFWERRAIAARYAPLDLLPPLYRDSDEVVRRVVVSRLAPEKRQFRHDSDREVRLAVAIRLPPSMLDKLVNDPDYFVRVAVAQRYPQGKLMRMAQDREREVRKIVAQRLPPFALYVLADDPEPEVRAIVAGRALPGLATHMLTDSEWWVRLAAVGNAPLDSLAGLIDDPEIEVREAALARLAQPALSQGDHNE